MTLLRRLGQKSSPSPSTPIPLIRVRGFSFSVQPRGHQEGLSQIHEKGRGGFYTIMSQLSTLWKGVKKRARAPSVLHSFPPPVDL